MNLSKAHELLHRPFSAIHLGIPEVIRGVTAQGKPMASVNFIPPLRGDLTLLKMFEKLVRSELWPVIHQANQEACQCFLKSQPHLVGVGLALDVIPGMEPNLFLHAGPPISWEQACGPMRGALLGGALLEGLAQSPEQAEQLMKSKTVRLDPCHHHQVVGPMAGVVTPSMPVWIIEDSQNPSRRTFSTFNEGLGKVLRYGAYSTEVLERLAFIASTVAPVISETLKRRGPIDLKMLMAQALQMGDEGHNRNRAGTSLLFRELAPTMVTLPFEQQQIGQVLQFIHKNDHFFLNLSMPMAKCMCLAAEGVRYSSMLTVMARNGTEFGIQLSSMPGRWFTGPAERVVGLFFPGFSEQDANPDIGDSAITETAGLGGFAMASAPAIIQFVGGTPQDALRTTQEMARICIGRNPTWSIPSLGFLGTPTGIDLLKVLELNLLPTINTGIAHRNPGIGQVGAGLVNPPWICFEKAWQAFFEHCQQHPTAH